MKSKKILILAVLISLMIYSISCSKEAIDDSETNIYLTVLHKSDSSAASNVSVKKIERDPFSSVFEISLGCTDQNGNIVLKTSQELKIKFTCNEYWASYQEKKFYPENKNPTLSKLLNHVIDTVYLIKNPKLYVTFNKVNAYSNQDTILVYLPYFGTRDYKLCNTVDGTTQQLGPSLSFNETYVIEWKINNTIFNDSIFTGNQEEVYYNLNY